MRLMGVRGWMRSPLLNGFGWVIVHRAFMVEGFFLNWENTGGWYGDGQNNLF